MSLNFNAVDVLQQIPCDSALRQFLGDRGVAVPDHWIDMAAVAPAITERIEAAAPEVRERVSGDLRKVMALACAKGQRLTYSVCANAPDVLDALSERTTPAQRALWLYVNHRTVFNSVDDALWLEESPRFFSKPHVLPVHPAVRRDKQSLRLFESAISQFYLRREGCGRVVKAYLIDRHGEGAVQVTVYVKDHAYHQTEFAGDRLERRPTTAARHLALVYIPATGEVRSVIRGGADYHDALVQAFAQCLLRVKIPAQRIRPLPLSLQPLCRPLPLPSDAQVETVQVRELTLLDQFTGSEIVLRAPAQQPRLSVHDLDQRWCPREPLLRNNLFRVIAGKLAVFYLPELASKPTPARRELIDLRKTGGTNLDEFDAATRARLLSYLREWQIAPNRDAGSTWSQHAAAGLETQP